MGSYTRQTVLFSRDGCSRLALIIVFLYGGYIPFVESLCFAKPIYTAAAARDAMLDKWETR